MELESDEFFTAEEKARRYIRAGIWCQSDLDRFYVQAEALWCLLDDISTAFDEGKPELQWFEKRVWNLCELRSRYFKSDGQKLFACDSADANNTPSGLPLR